MDYVIGFACLAFDIWFSWMYVLLVNPDLQRRKWRKEKAENTREKVCLYEDDGSKYFETDLSRIDDMEGHDFEYWCADLLRKFGYINVKVTPGSGDQGVDILASKNGMSYAFQCKRYQSNLGNKPVQEVSAGARFYNCNISVVITNSYFTSGAVELAKRTSVQLWDRNKLKEMLHDYKAG